ncbi:MAG: hypothetical protein OEV99_09210 [Nitrospira sp.]|nr:hypothetical protein [Nitrospira sp.]MDH4370014.1 hypothetical protein [Nitrospira sp.]MDH5347931.1 hypothetical protein [Nitrospira sp.]MDH5497762.1 hypothetical protein [Nitrospira sp.]MDH5724468.1 hypothetical protein [Nitrospira sp.]
MKRPRVFTVLGGMVALAVVMIALPANAQTVTPFQLVGHIQAFTLDDPMDPFSSAKLTVNGIQVTIPKNLVIQLPAAYFTAQQLFETAQGVSKKYHESGLALADKFPPLAGFEVTVDGNVVDDEYRAGLVSISQQSLNTSAGYIHQIDIGTGMMCVGGSPAATACARIRLNDPALDASDPFAGDGRYGKPNPLPPAVGPTDNPDSRYPDPRFTVDQGNPTVHALTGYPMCVPRAAADPECPASNRPPQNTFVMGPDPLVPPIRFDNNTIPACPACDSTKQVPLKVGDHITFAGTLARDTAGDYVSVHTLVADIGIYTQPGSNPAYVTLEESLLGTRGPTATCASAAECQDRLKIEGFTTDPSRRVSVYAVDVVRNGTSKVRLLHSTEKVQAVFGRFRYVPPLTAAALFDINGNLKGASRELMVSIDNPNPLPDGSEVPDVPKAAHGLVPGIYVAPVGEYVFPEPTGVQGGEQPALNFQCLAFLINGWALPPEMTDIQRLDPWPGASSPTFSCTN